jgi:hypothetical protein
MEPVSLANRGFEALSTPFQNRTFLGLALPRVTFCAVATQTPIMVESTAAAGQLGMGHKPRQKILYAGAELNRLYSECIISMSNHAV